MDALRASLIPPAAVLTIAGLLFSVDGRADSPDAAADQEYDAHNLILLAPAHPVFIQIRTQVDGKGLTSVRAAYAAQLLKQHDSSGDGLLDRDEAKSVPPLVKSATSNEMVAIADRWEAVDVSPADDKVSVEELAAYIDRVFGNTFLLSARPQRPTQSIDLFSLLDLNRDGKLSQDEFESAPASLYKLDLDDDETFTIDELQPYRNPQLPPMPSASSNEAADQPFLQLDAASIAKAAEQLIQRYGTKPEGAPAARLSRDRLGADAEAFAACDANSDGALDAVELAEFLRRPVPHLILSADLLQAKPGRPKLAVVEDRLKAISQPLPRAADKLAIEANGIGIELRIQANRAAVSNNRTFYKLKFRTADQDKNGYLDEQEFASVGVPNADFKSVDRNGDGMVMQGELMAFIEQDSASSQSRVELGIAHDGKSVFEVVDSNLDRRISRRELVRAFDRLRQFDRDGDEAITAVELTGRFKGTLELGKPLLFRNQMMNMRGDVTQPVTNAPTAGPEWFRKMDRNRDGDVSRREFLGPPALFRQLDADQDGLITAQEAEAATPEPARAAGSD